MQIVPNPDFIGALRVGITYALMVRIVNHGSTKHRVRLEEVGMCAARLVSLLVQPLVQSMCADSDAHIGH